MHLNLDPDTDQIAELGGLAERLPLFADQVGSRLERLIPGPGGRAAVYERDLQPWFGGEAALAILPSGGGAAEQVVLLEVSDPEGASGFADAIAPGAPASSEYRGVEIATDERGVSTAQTDGFLLIGSQRAVRTLLDTATAAEGSTALSDNRAAELARERLPEHRFLEVWLSAAGAAELLGGGGGGGLGSLAPFVSPGSTEGAAIALAADGAETLELAVRSRLDPERESASPGFFSAFPAFDQSLAERLPEDSLAYLGFARPGQTVRALVGQAAAQAPGIAAGFEDLVETLRRSEEIDLEQELLPALGEEAAIAIEPSKGAPFLEFVASGVNEARARAALARLQGPLADAVNPGSDLQAPVFGASEVAGVEVSSLRLSPALEVAYAVFDGLAVIATNPLGIERLAEGEGGLADSDRFERAVEDLSDDVSLLAFLDLDALIAQGFRIGLAQVPAFNTFADELRSLDAFALSVSSDEDLLSTDARLLISASAEGLTSRAND